MFAGLGRHRAARSALLDVFQEVRRHYPEGSRERVLPGRTTDLSWIEEQRAPTDADLVQALGLGSAQ